MPSIHPSPTPLATSKPKRRVLILKTFKKVAVTPPTPVAMALPAAPAKLAVPPQMPPPAKTSVKQAAAVKVASLPLGQLPETGFVRERAVLAVYPISRAGLWEGVKTGRLPKPVKLSARVTAWRVEDIRKLLESAKAESK